MSRPVVEKFEDELDMFGRPKKVVVTSPLEVMPDEERSKAEVKLEEQMRRDERRASQGGDAA
jgi:hypothetical protein